MEKGSAIFFMTGREPPDSVKMLSDKAAIVRDFLFIRDQRAGEARYDYSVTDSDPCLVYAFLMEPPYGGKRVRFDELPSPRAMRSESGYMVMDLREVTWCTADGDMSEGVVKLKLDTMRCAEKVSFRPTGNFYRQIAALDYIRANFCAGQPEPPPPPRRPY
jgi:hypothetical protein